MLREGGRGGREEKSEGRSEGWREGGREEKRGGRERRRENITVTCNRVLFSKSLCFVKDENSDPKKARALLIKLSLVSALPGTKGYVCVCVCVCV